MKLKHTKNTVLFWATRYVSVVFFVADLLFLLYAKKSQIRSLEFDANVSNARHALSFRPVFLHHSGVISMDFDSSQGYVYWVERRISESSVLYQV